jgi:pseudouridine synthase
MRLNKYLARSGIASRRKCDKLIESGKVVINGSINKDFSYVVNSNDIVVCDGRPVYSLPATKVYLVNKLKGYISTSFDPQGRKRVIDLVPSNDRLFTIGRLDRDTTGAILVTNDGELANRLMHPRNEINRVYIVASKLDIDKENRNLLQSGLDIGNRVRVKGKIDRLNVSGGLIYWRVLLKEGKNHEVKRIFLALKSKVIHLHRESFAGLGVENVSPGKYKKISHRDLKNLINVN